jgi:DNA-directed RNA polymerase specialized sigma24 family protein
VRPQEDFTLYNDEELLQLLKHDYKAAFTVLFDRHAVDLYIYIKHIVRYNTSDEQARCVAQKILIEVFFSLAHPSPPRSPPLTLADYLFTAAHQLAVDHVCYCEKKPVVVGLPAFPKHLKKGCK